MALYLIIIVEGLLFLYTFLASYFGLPLFEVFNFSNGYIRMIKAIIAQFSIFFAILLLIIGIYFMYKRVKDSDNFIDKDEVLQQLTGFVIFFGILLVLFFI